jgi:hypothetical protein
MPLPIGLPGNAPLPGSLRPYPFAALLARLRQERAVIAGSCVGLAAIALAWPALILGMQALTAQQVRHAIGAPSSTLLTLDTPTSYPARGYLRSGDAVWMSFDSLGGNAGFTDYIPDDLDMYVFPARAATSPCAAVGPTMQNALGLDTHGDGDCSRLSSNLWVCNGMPEQGAVTEIEAYHGYYVALSAD